MKRFTLLQFSLWLLALCAGIIANVMVFHSYSVEKQEHMQVSLQRYLDSHPQITVTDAPAMAEQLFATMNLKK